MFFETAYEAVYGRIFPASRFTMGKLNALVKKMEHRGGPTAVEDFLAGKTTLSVLDDVFLTDVFRTHKEIFVHPIQPNLKVANFFNEENKPGFKFHLDKTFREYFWDLVEKTPESGDFSIRETYQDILDVVLFAHIGEKKAVTTLAQLLWLVYQSEYPKGSPILNNMRRSNVCFIQDEKGFVRRVQVYRDSLGVWQFSASALGHIASHSSSKIISWA